MTSSGHLLLTSAHLEDSLVLYPLMPPATMRDSSTKAGGASSKVTRTRRVRLR